MPGGWKKTPPQGGSNTPPGSRTATPAHRKWRAAVLERDAHRCQIRDNGCTGTATEADHIREVADGGPEFDLSNGQAACSHCHSIKTSTHANRKRWQVKEKREQEKHPGLR